jgi:hypothetical protein
LLREKIARKRKDTSGSPPRYKAVRAVLEKEGSYLQRKLPVLSNIKDGPGDERATMGVRGKGVFAVLWHWACWAWLGCVVGGGQGGTLCDEEKGH